MNITNEKLLAIINQKKGINQNTNSYIGIILNTLTISSFSIKRDTNFYNIEYLSLQNNLLRDISFIKNLHNLYYLDLYKNSIEDFEPLNTKNIFGFLHISVEHFNEKKILQVRKLSVGIMKLDIEDKSYIKPFLNNNPNIIVLNNELIYLIDSLGLREAKRATKLSRTIMELNETEKKNKNSDMREKNDNNVKNSSIDKKIQNEKINELIDYFIHYASEVEQLLLLGETNTLRRMKVSPLYIKLERKKLVTLSKIYSHIIFYSNQIKNDNLFVANIKKNHPAFFDFSNLKHGSIQSSIIILITLLLFILNITSKNFTINILNYILIRYNKYEKENAITTDQPKFHLIPIYFDIYDHFVKNYNDKLLQIERKRLKMDLTQEKKYDEIIKALKMDNLIMKSNFLFHKMDLGYEKKMFNDKKNVLKEKIEMLDELNIKKEVTIFIQFLSDFLIFDKIDNKLLLDPNYKQDYGFFIEFKEHLFEKADVIPSTLSDKKYQQNQIENLNNAFYFKRGRIEVNTNQSEIFNFLDPFNGKKKVANTDGNIQQRVSLFKEQKKNKYLYEKLQTESYNFEDDYKIEDEIEVRDCITINKVPTYPKGKKNSDCNTLQSTNTQTANGVNIILPDISQTIPKNKGHFFYTPKKSVNHQRPVKINKNIIHKNSQSVSFNKAPALKLKIPNFTVIHHKKHETDKSPFKTIELTKYNNNFKIKKKVNHFSKGKIYNNSNTKLKIYRENEYEDENYMTARDLIGLFSIQSYDEELIRERNKKEGQLRKSTKI